MADKLYIHVGCLTLGRLVTLHADDLAIHTWHAHRRTTEDRHRRHLSLSRLRPRPRSLRRSIFPPRHSATLTTQHHWFRSMQAPKSHKAPSTPTLPAQTPGRPSTLTPIPNTASPGPQSIHGLVPVAQLCQSFGPTHGSSS